MELHIWEVLTLRAFKVSTRKKISFASELALFATLLYLLRGTTLIELEGLRNILGMVVVYLGARLVLGAIQIPLISTHRIRRRMGEDERDNLVLGTHALVNVLSIVAVALGAIAIYEIEVRSILTSLSLFSVAIVWLGKEYFSNFIDSFILMFSNDFKIGEHIGLSDKTKGVIQNITFRATQIRTDDGSTLFVPNSKIVHNEVTNFSKTWLKRIAIPFAMSRASLRDLSAFENELKSELRAFFPDIVDDDKKVNIRVLDIKKDEVQLSLEISVSAYSFKLEEKVKRWFTAYLLAKSS